MNEEEAAKEYYAAIMSQLMASPRFLDWFQCNFDVHKMVNEEEKSIEIRVLEVHPAIVEERMVALMAQKVEEDKSASPIIAPTKADLEEAMKMIGDK